MAIVVQETDIPEVKIIIGTRFHDERGFFTEMYKEGEYLSLGLPKFVQDNLSESSKGVIRGLHWQVAPYEQGKLVSCLAGSILDVAVDVRKESPTFGKHVAVILNSEESKSLWIPGGFAHGFQSLEDHTRVYYKVTNYWHRESERAVRFDDPLINIKWHGGVNLLSNKDLSAARLCEL